jgi:hypothetical protein
MTKQTLKNPSKKTRLASSKTKAGLRGLVDIDPKVTVVKEAASLIPFLGKVLIISGVVYLVVRSYKNRFIPKKENANYPVANITLSEAESRANSIYGSVGIFSGDFDTIVNAFSHPNGLNYNSFIRIYNAFGNRKSTYFSGEMNLSEWLADQLNDYQLSQISAITYGILV